MVFIIAHVGGMIWFMSYRRRSYGRRYFAPLSPKEKAIYKAGISKGQRKARRW